MQTISEAHSVDQVTDAEFWASVPLSNAGHQGSSLTVRHVVSHQNVPTKPAAVRATYFAQVEPDGAGLADTWGESTFATANSLRLCERLWRGARGTVVATPGVYFILGSGANSLTERRAHVVGFGRCKGGTGSRG